MAFEDDQILHRCYVDYFNGRGDWIWYEEYQVIKLTPKGAWIAKRQDVDIEPRHASVLEDLSSITPLRKKWVSNNTYFCSPTREEALYHLKRRTNAYVRHCKRRLEEAQRRANLLAKEAPPEQRPFLHTYNIGLLLRGDD